MNTMNNTMPTNEHLYECKVTRENDDETRYLEVRVTAAKGPFGIEDLKREILALFGETRPLTHLRYRDRQDDWITISPNETLTNIHRRARPIPANVFASDTLMRYRFRVADATVPSVPSVPSAPSAPVVRMARGGKPTPSTKSAFAPGEDIAVVWTLVNAGNAPLPEHVSVFPNNRRIRQALTFDAGTLDVSESLGGLAPDAQATIRLSVHMPDTAEPGKRYQTMFKFMDVETGRYIRGPAIKVSVIAATRESM
jgi:hypothetical protein